MLKVGSIVVKLSGRDAGQICVIVEELDNNFVLIEGNTRRRKCNIRHLQPLGKEVNIKKGANREEVLNALRNSDLKFKEIKKGERREKGMQIKSKRHAKKYDENKITKQETELSTKKIKTNKGKDK